MKDRYPAESTVPAAWLVPPGRQPDYEAVEVPEVTDRSTVADALADRHVRAGRGDAVAAIHAETGRSYSFAALADRSDALARGLVGAGLRVGDRVAFRTPNDPECLAVVLAIWKAGGVVVPVPVHARGGEFRHFLEDSAARFLFVHARSGGFAEIAEIAQGTAVERIFAFGAGESAAPFEAAETLAGCLDAALPSLSADHVAILWHTGGTTGRPKGCYHTHRRFLLGGYLLGRVTGADFGARWAAAAPVGHALGFIYHTIYTLLHGATAVFIEAFHDPDTLLRAIAAHRITTFTALTASWARMAERLRDGASCDTGSLTRCYAMWQSASSSEIYDFWRGRGVELLNNFGSTAFGTWILVPHPGDVTPRASLGRPLPGYRVEAVDMSGGSVRPVPPGTIGRMAVRGATGLTYWNIPDKQETDVVDGWTLSDDLLMFDAEGNAHYLGRSDFMISTAGFKVAPVEVEAVLARHPAVREVAVVPAPCPIRQQQVAAYVALRPGQAGDAAMTEALQAFVRAELSSYKVPRLVRYVDGLPRDPVGKVRTREVRDWAERDAGDATRDRQP
ncbi:MAG: AMP-binding protein [Alphaproteobacteria bacterium]